MSFDVEMRIGFPAHRAVLRRRQTVGEHREMDEMPTDVPRRLEMSGTLPLDRSNAPK